MPYRWQVGNIVHKTSKLFSYLDSAAKTCVVRALLGDPASCLAFNLVICPALKDSGFATAPGPYLVETAIIHTVLS